MIIELINSLIKETVAGSFPSSANVGPGAGGIIYPIGGVNKTIPHISPVLIAPGETKKKNSYKYKHNINESVTGVIVTKNKPKIQNKLFSRSDKLISFDKTNARRYPAVFKTRKFTT